MTTNLNELRALLHTRAYGNPDEYFIETLWENEIKCVCSDMAASIEFVTFECTDEEFYFLSEIFDDIMKETRSIDFHECIRKRADQVENIQWRNEIVEDIKFEALYAE